MAPENEKGEGTDNENLFDKYWNEEAGIHDEKPDSDAIYNKLKNELFPSASPSTVSINKNRGWLRYVAAAVILLAGGSVWYAQTRSKPSFVEKEIISINTKKGENKLITLPDSSNVQLSENSVLSYSSSLGTESTRQVTLKGDATFTILHNAEKPFILSAGPLTIKDIGTVFKVAMNNRSNNGIDVKVTEGSVSVQNSRGTKNEMILSKGDEAVYNPANDKLIVNKAVTLAIVETASITFENAPLSAVLKKITDTYGVKINIEGNKSTTKTYTGAFENKNIDEVLEQIGFTLGFKHSRKDDIISISFYGDEK